MSDSRATVLDRLRQAPPDPSPVLSNFAILDRPYQSPAGLFDRFRTTIESVHGEVVVCNRDWTGQLASLYAREGWRGLAFGPKGPLGARLAADLGDRLDLLPFDRPFEKLKSDLFRIDAGLTATLGAVAETGSLLLFPGPEEPRTLSIVPDVHVAVLDRSRLYPTLSAALDAQGWAERMPTNALVISGPSKTADIEQTLVFGAHGPRRLIVLAVDAG